MNYLIKRKVTSFLVLCSFTLSPILPAYAQESSDQTKSLDTQVSMAKTSKTFHTVESVVFGAAMATTLVLGLIPCAGPQAAVCYPAKLAACNQISLGANLAGMAADIALGIVTGDMQSALTSTMTSAVSLGTQALTGSGLALGKTGATTAANSSITEAGGKTGLKMTVDGTKYVEGDTANKAASKAVRLGCLMASATLGLKEAQYIAGLSSDNKTIATATTSKNELIAARPTAGFIVGGGGTSAPDTGSKTPGVAGSAVADSSCGAQSGNNYLKCATGVKADSAAITNNTDAMNAIQDAMGGKNLGDLAKGFTGNTAADLGKYIGDNMGLGSTGSTALAGAMENAQKYAQESGLIDKFAPGAYVASNNHSSSAASTDMDFNKMMEGMLKQLNPDATDKKGEDPSNIVFRTLDLLPADKIEANKDISLFARIGYRYRKKTNDMEHLNWSSPANQTMNSAPVSSTDTASARAPGSSR